MLACFLSYFSVLDRVGTSPTRSSLLLGFLNLVVAQKEDARRKKFSREEQQVVSEHPASSWDRESIPRSSVAVRQRSCVDLETALELFVGSCVDLKTVFGLLEESNLEE